MESFLIVWVVFFSCEVLGMWNFRVSGQGTILRFLQSFFKVSLESHWSLFRVYLKSYRSLFGVPS